MIGKTPKEHQMSIFEVALKSFIDMNHELVLLSNQIDWDTAKRFGSVIFGNENKSACLCANLATLA